MSIETQNALATSYKDLEKGIYTDTPNQQFVVRGCHHDVQFISMANTTEEQLRGMYILEWKGELAEFLAADAAPYVPPTAAERNRQLTRDLINLEIFIGSNNFRRVTNDHNGGSSMTGRLLGLY